MLAFATVLERLKAENMCPARAHLTRPDWAIDSVLLHPASLHRMRENSVCVQYVSEFMGGSARPDGLYLLICDRKQDLDFRPETGNWAIFPPTVSDHLLGACLHRLHMASQRVDMATLRLSQSLLRKDGPEAIAAIGERVLGNPIFLSDTTTKVLLFSNMEALLGVQDELIQSITTHGFVTAEFFDKYEYPALLASIENSSGAFLCKSRFAAKEDRIIARLTVNDSYYGWIVAFPRFRPFQEGDCEIMDVLAGVLTVELEKKTGDHTFSHREGLLLELMSGHLTNDDEFWTRANYLGWRKSSHYHVVVIGQSPAQIDPSKPRAVLAYKNQLALSFPDIQIIPIRNHLALLLETERVEPILVPLQRFLAGHQLSAAVSSSFQSILQFSEHYEQASGILDIGPRVCPDDMIYSYNTLYLHHYVAAFSKTYPPESCYMPEFLALLRYDAQYHTNYLETLRVYLKHRNAISTAAALHIHRNTMNYRLQKIQEIAGQDLTEGDNLYRLWFSFMLYDLSERGPSDGVL